MRRYLIAVVAVAAVSFVAGPALAAIQAPVTPNDLTAWSMFMGADWVVKAVMLLLVCASIATWAICIARHNDFRRASRTLAMDEATLGEAMTLDGVKPLGCAASVKLLAAAREEVKGCVDLSNARSADAMTERLSIRLAAVEGSAAQSMRAGFSVLASIGATGPFVGLFGTVWGIMNSFIGISHAQATSLAVVAPGIAEALLATGLGLVAAIPAVLVYNIFSRRMADFRRRVHHVSVRVACLASHEAERAQVGRLKLAS